MADTERNIGRIHTSSRRHAAQKAIAARCDLARALVVEAGQHGVQVGTLGQRIAVSHAVGVGIGIDSTLVIQALNAVTMVWAPRVMR